MSRSRAFRVAATSARLVTGGVVIVACVAGIAAAVHAPWPTIRHDAAQVQVTPLPGDSVLVCNGDLRALGRDAIDPLNMSSAATPSLTVGGTSGDPAAEELAVKDIPDAGEVRVLTGAVEARTAPLIAAAESVSIATDDLAGYAAAPCGVPKLDSWLVGGSTATGTEDILVLTNAAEVPSTVTLSVYGETRSARTVIVPARTQTAIPLTSIAAGSATPVVRVGAVGAPVRAVLQSSLVQVLDPAGIDLQDAVAGPQEELVIAGVQVFSSAGDDAEMAVLRVLSPGVDARVQVQVRAEGSSAVVDEFSVPVEADLPAQVSLTGLAPGSYTVDVVADVPVLAALRQQDGFGRDSDFAWITPAPEIEGDVLFAVPSGPEPRLQLANTSDQSVTVTLETLDGAPPTELVIAAGETLGAEVDAGATYRMRTDGPVHAALALTAPGAIAVLPVQASAGVEKAITVYP
ncbi:DUF5719 family protein [Microbacterium paraoxydans]|uniref:DUF5719 family protein n=1 Tax=Microbacterium paraoxydans TaxID=199592 RepID=UPI001CFA917B|nr:DUF5719 family protein [Microbacterium paraoxydans]